MLIVFVDRLYFKNIIKIKRIITKTIQTQSGAKKFLFQYSKLSFYDFMIKVM